MCIRIHIGSKRDDDADDEEDVAVVERKKYENFSVNHEKMYGVCVKIKIIICECNNVSISIIRR